MRKEKRTEDSRERERIEGRKNNEKESEYHIFLLDECAVDHIISSLTLYSNELILI